MPKWLRALGALLSLSLAGCGDGTFIIAVNSGVIVGDPRCQGRGGQFDLRERGGLVVLVVITSSTRIVVAGGGPGTCTDLSAGAPVEVSGRDSGDRIVASSVTVRGLAHRLERPTADYTDGTDYADPLEI